MPDIRPRRKARPGQRRAYANLAHLSELRNRQTGVNADRRLPVLLWLCRLWRAAQTQARRLLRVLLIWVDPVPTSTVGDTPKHVRLLHHATSVKEATNEMASFERE